MPNKQVNVRAVVFKSGDHWLAQCLEYDIAAQATALKEVPYQFERAIVGHIVIARENDLEPFSNIPQAPKRFWDMFDEGVKLSPPKEHIFMVHESIKTEVREMRVSDLIGQAV